jgi:hypothetical protein
MRVWNVTLVVVVAMRQASFGYQLTTMYLTWSLSAINVAT